MTDKEIVITGIGVIAANRIGKEAFTEAVFGGIGGIGPISAFDASGYSCKSAAEARDFDAQQILGPKGLRTLDRTTMLALSAAKLAIDDAGLVVDESNSRSVGVALASTLGCVKSVCDFDKDALKDGPRYVNPAMFPNTVLNSPGSQISIRFNIKGFNSTISTGFSAGLDALNYAADMLRWGRAKTVLAGGVEEFCLETFLGFYKAGFLSSGLQTSCPFDLRRDGILLGEAAVMLVLEGLDSALERKANIYGRFSGYGTSFSASCRKSMASAMRNAIDAGGIKKEDIGYICAAANSSRTLDSAEAAAIGDVFGQRAQEVPVSSMKSITAECFSASGALQAALAAQALHKQAIPPTVNYQQPDPDCGINLVVNEARSSKLENILINAACPGRVCSSAVVSKL